MKIRGIEFGSVFMAAGARNFDGKGYWFHPLLHLFTVRDPFKGSTLVTKTTTWNARLNPASGEGNMPMKDDGITPAERFPRCVYVTPKSWLRGEILNAVGLSGPGAVPLVMSGRWKTFTKPFVISFMAVGKTRPDRILEWACFVKLLKENADSFMAPFAVEINVSCPNVGLDARHLIEDVWKMLSLGACLKIPFIVNINLLISPETATQIALHPDCDAISQSNSIPWGTFPERIPWKELFGSDESPLVKRGLSPGGYSGPRALPILRDWIRAARQTDLQKPLIVGGGIQTKADLIEVLELGKPLVKGVKFGVLPMVRPWRVQPMIRAANTWFAAYS